MKFNLVYDKTLYFTTELDVTEEASNNRATNKKKKNPNGMTGCAQKLYD